MADSLKLSSYGYFGGGYTPGSSSATDRVDRIDFSNETGSAPGNELSQARYGLGAVSNRSLWLLWWW